MRMLFDRKPKDVESGREAEPRVSWVHLVSMQTKDGTPHVVATCLLQEGVVTFKGEEGFIASLRQGIAFGPDRIILPEQGKEFLEALLTQYRHPYLFATPIRSGDEVIPYKG